MVSGIVHVLKSGGRWADAPEVYGQLYFGPDVPHGVGANAKGTNPASVKLALVILVSEQSLIASDFVESDGGNRVPKDYPELGADISSNGYNFTLKNMDSTHLDTVVP